MEYLSLLFFGSVVGMQHALEADHLAAIATLSAGSTSRRALLLRGGIWGVGHTITLLTISGLLLMFGETIPARTALLLEFAVGAMIILLGANVLLKLFRQRVHFHFHQHGDNAVHVHTHSHANDTVPHLGSSHDHEHHNAGFVRVLAIGMMHGAAGSAGLLVLAAATNTLAQAIGYVLAFGAGSIIGMAAMSFVAAFPLRLMERYANWLNTAAFACVGCVAIVIGGSLMGDSWRGL